MDKARALKKITREVLGDRPGSSFYNKINWMLDEADWSNASLVSVTKEIERMVKLFIGVEFAGMLEKRYKDFFINNTSHI